MDNHLQLIFWWNPCHSHHKFFLHNPCNRCEDHLLEILFDGTQMRSIYWEGLITKVVGLIKKIYICMYLFYLWLTIDARPESPSWEIGKKESCAWSSKFIGSQCSRNTVPFVLNLNLFIQIKRIRNISHLHT